MKNTSTYILAALIIAVLIWYFYGKYQQKYQIQTTNQLTGVSYNGYGEVMPGKLL
jgi:ABC-type amino acid transport system permease subunit